MTFVEISEIDNRYERNQAEAQRDGKGSKGTDVPSNCGEESWPEETEPCDILREVSIS